MQANPNKRKRKRYTIKQMADAVEAVKSGVPINDAAHIFKVPRATLHDKTYAKYPEDATSGAPTVLSKDEEKRLVKFILNLSNVGFKITKQQIFVAVKRHVTSLSKPNAFKNNTPGRTWYLGFLSRNPYVKNVVCPDTINPIRPAESWFDRMHILLKSEKKNFTDPRRVFICDESSFFTNPKFNNDIVVFRDTNKGYKKPSYDKRESVTLLLCASADGQMQPPCFIYPPRNTQIPGNITLNTPINLCFKQSENGRTNEDILNEYMTKEFYPWLLDREIPFPVVLFMDLQSCPIDLFLSEFCADKQIILISLPQNTLHPIETAILRPFTHYCIQQMPGIAQYANFKIEDFAKVFYTYLKEVEDLIPSAEIINEFRNSQLCLFGTDSVTKTKKYTRNKEQPLESNMGVDLPLRIEDGTTEKNAEKYKVYVRGPTWQRDRSIGAFFETQNATESTSTQARGSAEDSELQSEPLQPVSSTFVAINCDGDGAEPKQALGTSSMESYNIKNLEGENIGNDLEICKNFEAKDKIVYYLNKKGKGVSVSVARSSLKLVTKRLKQNFQPYTRTREKESETRYVHLEPEVSVPIEEDESRDPLDLLAVAGPSRLWKCIDNTVQSKQAPNILKEIALDSKEEAMPLRISAPISLAVDIKKENSPEQPRLPIDDILADFNEESHDDVPESDIINLSHQQRSKAVESGSDSSVYFKGPNNSKRKQKVTTELLFHRYKIKSKREIDRLNNKIRELKASVEKYKRLVHRLKRRPDNVKDDT